MKDRYEYVAFLVRQVGSSERFDTVGKSNLSLEQELNQHGSQGYRVISVTPFEDKKLHVVMERKRDRANEEE